MEQKNKITSLICGVVVAISLHLYLINSVEAAIETTLITRVSEDGVTYEELAFPAPKTGYPEAMMNTYCAAMKVRLYWNEWKQEIQKPLRRSEALKQMGKMALKLFSDIQGIDDRLDGTTADDDGDEDENEKITDDSVPESAIEKDAPKVSNEKAIDEIQSSDAFKELFKQKGSVAIDIIKKWVPIVSKGVRIRYMSAWWLMMSCIFVKYYLYDPALGEWLNLQRWMPQYPDFQELQLKNQSCKPVRFFIRLLDVCKIINPLFNISLGQFSLDHMMKY